jgi:gas vesicle protein
MMPETTEAMKPETADNVPKSGRVAKAVGAAIAGATVGYVAGTLIAPASGEQTRQRIARRVDEETRAAAGKARRSIATAKDEAKLLAGKARKSVKSAQDKLADKIHS